MPWKDQPFGWGVPKPYLEYLPEPQDASMNVMRQITEHLSNGSLDSGGDIKMGLNYIEAPSNKLAMQLQFLAYNTDCKIKISAAGVPRPDPRKSAARFKLWKYWFKKASPAVKTPERRLAEAVASLAVQPYSYDAHWHQAETIARQLSGGNPREVVAVMVHPPPVREGIPAWVWLPRVQLAAAQIAARLEIQQGMGVDQSILAEIVMGPIDWTIDAAVIALTQWARMDPAQNETVANLFNQALNRIPNEGYFSCAEAIVRNWLLLPNVSTEEREQLNAWVAALEAGGSD